MTSPSAGPRRVAGPATPRIEPTADEAAIRVEGNVEGSVVKGDKNIVVNHLYGSLINETIQPKRERRPSAPAPRPPVPFVARANELAELTAAIATTGGRVTMSGRRGAGRTALMRAAATRATSDVARNVLRIDGTDDGRALSLDDLAQLVHDAAWECVPTVEVDASSARAALGDVQALALIDDVALSGRELERLTDLLPNGAVIVTTRRTVMDSDVPDVPVAALPRGDAIALLLARSSLPPETDSADLDAICGLLADWPEALVVAGRAIQVRGLAVSAARTELSVAAPRSADVTVAGLERAYALAYPALDENALRVLIAAAVIPGNTHDPDVLRRVLGSPEWFDSAAETLTSLDLLALNSPRFRVPDGLRDVIREGAEGGREVVDEHLAVLVQRAHERVLDPVLPVSELGGLLGAFDHAVRYGRFEAAIDLGRWIVPRLVLAGLWDAWGSTARGVRSVAEKLQRIGDVAWATHELGTRELALEQYSEATDLLLEALQLRRGIGEVKGAAYTLHNLRWLGVVGSGPDGGPSDGGRHPFTRHPFIFGGGLIALELVLLVAAGPTVGEVFDQLVNGPSPSPSAEATARPTDQPIPGPSATRGLVPLAGEARDYGYVIDGDRWSGTFEVGLSGGEPPYLVELADGSRSDANPASFPISGFTCFPVVVLVTATSGDKQVLTFERALLPDPCATPRPPPDPVCIDFDDLEPERLFGLEAGDKPGDVILTSPSGVRVTIREFLFSPDEPFFGTGFITPASDGFGEDQVVFTGTTQFQFDFLALDFLPEVVDLDIRDQSGGGANLSVNDSELFIGDLRSSAPAELGGASVNVDMGDPFVDFGHLTLKGPVDLVAIGGSEFSLDNVCASP